ncbi:hypothetical protein AMATHDRAFT_1925 [Amanita thiersii Skay4041]|uniref:Protein kinase domain-containing protein n=1 Tax=Amanita thiersii Skay4041 TaxID=703135 RepID=A0A2A9NQX9_9AGAR|nr:hypothetical protein AMATHDRAFT_1925 [Amanita thiersii Skay4041]
MYTLLTFLEDLIRHGKNHNQSRQDHPKQHPRDNPQTPKDQSSRTSHQPIPPSSATPSTTKHMSAPPPANQAPALIANEQSDSYPKMPSYRGLENFRLLEKMGECACIPLIASFSLMAVSGAFSNVYKATDLTTKHKVAVKVVRKYELNASQVGVVFPSFASSNPGTLAGEKHLNPQFKKKPRVTERSNILKEVQIMRTTNHPSIVKLYSFSESPEHYFLVLELMEGGELFHQIVKLTYFSENLSRHVILQVAQGIRYLHEERGVVHRDIKPENLLFERIPIIPSKHPVQRPYDEDKEDEGEFIPGLGGGGIGRVKIADFGLSKVIWNEQTMTPCGTVGYTAPEIVKDERYSKSVDMWALGCVLYTLLCGFPPFYDESINVLTEKVARGYYTFLSPWWDDISHSAKDLIRHLLCVDPAQRYTIDEFLAHPWCNTAPVSPSPPSPFISGKDIWATRSLDSPLLTAAFGGRVEGRSPGLATLKEAFDITYAVHLMEEEGARRKYRGNGFLGGLDEGEEDEEISDEGFDTASPDLDTHTSASGNAGGKTGDVMRERGVAGVRNTGNRKQNSPKGFELDLEGATLLGRRHRRGVGNHPSSPLSGKPVTSSPLKLESLRVDDTVEEGSKHHN